MNSNLTPEQRPDKNGRIVTRHVLSQKNKASHLEHRNLPFPKMPKSSPPFPKSEPQVVTDEEKLSNQQDRCYEAISKHGMALIEYAERNPRAEHDPMERYMLDEDYDAVEILGQIMDDPHNTFSLEELSDTIDALNRVGLTSIDTPIESRKESVSYHAHLYLKNHRAYSGTGDDVLLSVYDQYCHRGLDSYIASMPHATVGNAPAFDAYMQHKAKLADS